MNSVIRTIPNPVDQINSILSPLLSKVKSPEDFHLVDSAIEQLNSLCELNKIDAKDIHQQLKNVYRDWNIKSTIQDHALSKPYGYSGDFAIIDKIYTEWNSSDPNLALWDNYFHKSCAAIAVRNRKAYFKDLVKTQSSGKRSIRILNLASGPARDILEMFIENQESVDIKVTCVDLDEKAIEYAQDLTLGYNDRIEFIHKNIFRFDTREKYDLVWSAGLFDYFDNKTFVRILMRAKSWVKEGGKMVVGNFNDEYNPSRAYMELFGDWYLHHRSSVELTNLAIESGYERAAITVGMEEENVNLFMHIQF